MQGVESLHFDNITFTTTDKTINTHNTELQMVKVHINNTKHITIANIYVPHPRTTKQLTQTYNTAYSISQTYHTQSSPINIQYDYRLQQNRRTFTNYKKADWTQFTGDTDSVFAQTTIPTNIHTANIILQTSYCWVVGHFGLVYF